MTDLHTHTNGAANGHAFSTINDNTTIISSILTNASQAEQQMKLLNHIERVITNSINSNNGHLSTIINQRAKTG